MSTYALTDYPQIDIDNASVVIAFSNLLQRFDVDIEPLNLNIILTHDDPHIDLWTVASYIEGVEVSEVYQDGWPPSSNAIVKFQRIEPLAAGMVDHYCLVADAKAHSIIDSLDGSIKAASTYGEVLGWASYVLVDPDAPPDDVPAPKPESLYTVLSGGESVYNISQKVGVSATELIEHNDIETPSLIPEGTILHLPIPRMVKSAPTVRYELLDKPMDMHVSKQPNATKYSFGNVKKWKDIVASGPTYPTNTNIRIVAMAYVPIPEDGSEAKYYIDAISLGNYRDTKRVAYTTGFNHTHLEEGYLENPTPVLTPEIKARIKEASEAAVAQIKPEPKPLPKIADIAPPRPAPNVYKATLKPMNEHRESVMYIAKDTIMVREMDGRRPDHTLYENNGVWLMGTFEKDGVKYGLPESHVKNGYWFGIPMDVLNSEDEVYLRTDTPLVERMAAPHGGMLSPYERYWAVPFARTVSQYTRLTEMIKNRKEKR